MYAPLGPPVTKGGNVGDDHRGVAGGEDAGLSPRGEGVGLGARYQWRPPSSVPMRSSEASVDGVSEQTMSRDIVVVSEFECVEEAVFVGVGEEEGPGLAAVGGFVDAGKVAFAAAHDDGGVVAEGLDCAEVEVIAAGRFGAELPDEAGVFSAEDGAVGARGPGDAIAEVLDAAEVGGGVGVLELPPGGEAQLWRWRAARGGGVGPGHRGVSKESIPPGGRPLLSFLHGRETRG